MTQLERHDPLYARFRSAINKRDAKKTGLKKTETFYYECTSCGAVHRGGKTAPATCGAPHKNPMVDRPCPSRTFKQYNDLEVEAMPIGRVTIYQHKRTTW